MPLQDMKLYGVLKKIQECNIRNYSIFRNGTEVFSYFEYIGSDYDADMHQMEMDETTQQWWTYTHPCFERYAVSSQSEFFHDMKQIFYFDEIKSEEGTAKVVRCHCQRSAGGG